MTSRRDYRYVNLGRLIRQAVASSVARSMASVRTPKVLSGNVEQVDEDRDVVWVRVDDEAMTGDPTQSSNYEMPGVIPASRIGEVLANEPVRMTFEGSAGANAFRTSGENVIVIPYGAESGRRIVIDGNAGVIAFFDESDELVGLLNTDQWAIGNVGSLGARVTLDPVGGVRIRSANDALVVLIDQNGVTLRDATSGLVVADLKPGSFRMVDPAGTDDIEMVTASAGTLPNPAYRNQVEANPGATFVVPGAPTFTKPIDDIEIAHVAGWRRAVSQAATMTPPAGFTEHTDNSVADAAGSLHTSVAIRDPAVASTPATFTSSQATWDHAIGTSVILKGGGAVSPSIRSVSESSQITTALNAEAVIAKPAGLAVGDVLLAFVSLGVNGGFVPTGWVTPPGFQQLGANFSASGTGAAQTTVAAGVWAKLADAADVAAADFRTTINLPTGTKVIHGAMVAIQNAFLVPGGVQLRMAGKPVRRQIAFAQLTAANAELCDFTNISQAYDNLEFVYDASTAGGSTLQTLNFQFNGDTALHYHDRATEDGGTNYAALGRGSIRFGRIDNTIAGAKSTGSMHIYGYRSSPKPVVMGQTWWTGNLAVARASNAGQWDGNAGVSAINRIRVFLSAGTFAVGSRAYLYAY